MSEGTIGILAGDCSLRFESGDDQPHEERGTVLVIVKPDDTVLVHDRGGYRPAAWLTRAETVSIRTAGEGTVIDAVDGDRRLIITCHGGNGVTQYPVTGVGAPAGQCPSCGGPLVRTTADVECLDCRDSHAIPRDASLRPETCQDCGQPTMRVERGAKFDLCVDRTCESLDDRVRQRFDGVWNCPECGSPLRILRRGGLIAGCEAYPDCECGFTVPTGVEEGRCNHCDLPAFRTAAGRRCLDTTCAGP